MNVEKYLEKMKKIQENLLSFLDDETNEEVNFQNLNQTFQDKQLRDNQHDLRLFFHSIVKIANNHHRGPNFFNKIDRILTLFKDDIKKYSNSEIFNLFRSNKRLLLFLIEEKIMTVDEYIAKKLITKEYVKKNYTQFFSPELQTFVNEEWFPKHKPFNDFQCEDFWVEDINKELPSNFNELRKNGENGSYICSLIRADAIDDFITYVNKSNISLKSVIETSIYETNSFLTNNNKGVELINYAAFFGSAQIFKYLKVNGVELNHSLLYSIHGRNPELINICEKTYYVNEIYLDESIKCLHNEIADYILDNYLQNKGEKTRNVFIHSLEYYNFKFLQKESIIDLFGYLCQYDYYSLVKYLITGSNVDINQYIIQH